MTKEELMKIRYMVIQNAPLLTNKKGEIITCNHPYVTIECNFLFAKKVDIDPDTYPHIFRKLNWWECRNVEDMPKKIQSKTQIVEPNWVQEEWNGFKYMRAYDTESAKYNIISSFRLESFVPIDDEPK
jgi:hypothetical protein